MKKLVVVLVIALVALGGGAIHLWRQHDADRLQIANLQAQLTQVQATRQVVAAAPTTPVPTATEREPRAAAVPAAPRPQVAAVTEARVKELTAALRENAASPEALERQRPLRRAMLVQRYPDLGKELGLSADELNKLFDLLVQQDLDRSAIVMGGANDDAEARQQQMKKMQASQQSDQAELTSMLGSKYQQWQDYQQTLPGRRQVTDLRAVLNASGSPLSDAQAGPLIAALAAEQKRITSDAVESARKGGGAVTLPLLQSSPENNQRLIEAATPYLNPQQLESFRQMRERQANMDRAMLGGLSAAPAQGGTEPPR